MKLSYCTSCKHPVLSLLFLSVFLLNGLSAPAAPGKAIGQKPVFIQNSGAKKVEMILRCDVYDTHVLSSEGFAGLLCRHIANRLAARMVNAEDFAYIVDQGGARQMGHLTVRVKKANRIVYRFVKGTADEWGDNSPPKSHESEIMVMDAGHLTPVIDQLVLDLERMK